MSICLTDPTHPSPAGISTSFHPRTKAESSSMAGWITYSPTVYLCHIDRKIVSKIN
jgi:hypothetical protein